MECLVYYLISNTSQITECAKNLHQKAAQNAITTTALTSVSDDEGDQDEDEDEDEPLTVVPDHLSCSTLERLSAWQNVVSDSRTLPERVLLVLLEAQEFEVARRWGRIHAIDQVYRQVSREWMQKNSKNQLKCQASEGDCDADESRIGKIVCKKKKV